MVQPSILPGDAVGQRSVQLNIRTAASVAEALREEALRRDVPLGSVLEELLTRARASRETGVWLDLPTEVSTALRAVAGARGLEPEQLLEQLLAADLRRTILQMADDLRTGSSSPEPDPAQVELRRGPPGGEAAGGSPSAPLPTKEGASQDVEDDDEQVGIFTVFE